MWVRCQALRVHASVYDGQAKYDVYTSFRVQAVVAGVHRVTEL